MIGKVAQIPFSRISKIGLYINSSKKTMAQVKQKTGCDYILNAGLFNMTTFKPVNYLTASGKVLSTDGNPYGYSFNEEKVVFSYNNHANAPDFIGAYPCLIKDGKVEQFVVPSGLGGDRGRSAIGLTNDSVVLRCVPDVAGSSDYTLQELANDMLSLGCISAINLDGGGSSQCDFTGDTITSSRKVHNFICIWLKEEKKMPTIVLDAGHGIETAGKCSPDKSFYEYEFNLDMANRIKTILERHGVTVKMTRTDTHLLASTDSTCLKKRVEIANAIKNLDLFVSIHANAASGTGWSNAKGLEIFTSSAGDTAKRNIAANRIIAQAKSEGITLRNPTLKHEAFYVLKYTVAPAVLIEHGFYTNKDEVEQLKSTSYREKFAIVDAKGILDYLGITYKSDTPTTEHWAEKYLDDLAKRGIVTDPEKHRGSLDDTFTKGEILAMLSRM